MFERLRMWLARRFASYALYIMPGRDRKVTLHRIRPNGVEHDIEMTVESEKADD